MQSARVDLIALANEMVLGDVAVARLGNPGELLRPASAQDLRGFSFCTRRNVWSPIVAT